MKKIPFILLALTFVFSDCKKESTLFINDLP